MFWILASLPLLAWVVIAKDSSTSKAAIGPPKAKVEPVEEERYGHKLVDNYRYLENAADPRTEQYVRQEMAYTRSLLDPLQGRERIHARLRQLLTIGDINAPQPGGDRYFYTRREGLQNQPVLYVREGVEGKDRVLVDTNQLSADGTIALDWWAPTHNGEYVAYGTSLSGSEMSTLHVIETATGKLLSDTIERTRAASLAWKLDNSGFYYTRYPKKGDVPEGQEMYNRRVFYHALGADPARDALIFGSGRDPEDWTHVQLSDDDRWLLITVEQGWTKSELYLADLKAGTAPVRITEGKDCLYRADAFEGKLYITSNEDAPRYRVFVADATHPARQSWKQIIPQSDAVLQSTAVFGGKLFALYEKNATSQLKLFSLDGMAIADIPLPALGTVAALGGSWDRDEAFFGFESFTLAPSIYRYDLRSHKSALWAKVDAPSMSSSAYQVNQVWYTSKDGTRVPMFVVHHQGLEKNGKNPTLLTGYGGFNVSLTPKFDRAAYLWLEHGGVYAVANLRGGAEFGEDWHRAGMLGQKQHVFDDFIAAAQYLMKTNYTDSEHLAIQGGSNGGLLMGAALTQRPDLFHAVICRVPLLDMLRYQNFQIAKLWVPEYGSADDAKQFEWLYAYSPYHHVKADLEYPAILFRSSGFLVGV